MYKYDAKGNLYTVTNVTTGSDKLMAKYSYDANDNLSSVTYGNGTSTTYTYNNGNMIQTVSNIGADNKNMSYYSYEYYLDGNVSKQNRNGVNCYYDYDVFSRITDEDYGNEEIDYYYDAAGNRTLKTICDDNGDTEVNYTYDLNNRLLEESNHSYANNETDVTKYVYDNNGNQIKKIGYTTKDVNGSPSQDLVSENELNNTYEMYKYNEFNEMTSFESNKEAVWYYAYLPNGLRYRKHKNNYNNSDWFVWDRNGNIIAEMNNNKEYTNKYVRGNKLISKNDNEYYSYDGHGSVVNISNESGKSIKSYDYDAFGVELNKDANDTNLFRYCGEQYDNETDSIYLRARYYSPSLGRFTTEDPVKDGDNWYSYCAGNPVNGWDPSGLKTYIICGPDQTEAQERNKEDLEAKGEECEFHSVENPGGFISTWNSLTEVMTDEDDLIINIHGTSTEMSINKEGGVIDLSRLNSITANSIELFVCNAGVLSNTNNIAVQMLNSNNVRFVIAPDGINKREHSTVKTDEPIRNEDGSLVYRTKEVYEKEMSVIENDEYTFELNRLQTNQNRKSQGYIIYYKKSKNGIIHHKSVAGVNVKLSDYQVISSGNIVYRQNMN